MTARPSMDARPNEAGTGAWYVAVQATESPTTITRSRTGRSEAPGSGSASSGAIVGGGWSA